MNTDTDNENSPLTSEEEREIQRGYDHLVSGVKQPQYRCRRCGERVNMIKKVCGCTQSPSPWELEQPPDTPHQPAHGEPWRGDSDGIYNALGERLSHHENDCGEIARTVQCVNLLSPHPDLSAVEVHSKETMDEVRAALWSCENHRYSDGMLHHQTFDNKAIQAVLAKLNPPQ